MNIHICYDSVFFDNAKYSSLTLGSLVTEIRLPLLGKGQCIFRFSEKTGIFFFSSSCADLVSSSKYRETADMYSEFGPNTNEDTMEIPGFEGNERAPPPIPKRNQRVKFDDESIARKTSTESTYTKGYYYNSNLADLTFEIKVNHQRCVFKSLWYLPRLFLCL